MNEEKKQEMSQNLAFSMTKGRMKGLDKRLGAVSENHEDFEKLATPEMKKAVEIAQKNAGVVDRDANWEQKATPEEREARRQETLRKEKKHEETELAKVNNLVRAKYKIEIMFMPGRKVQGPNLVGITIWESGKRFHGGGDEKIFFCKDSRQGHNEGCWGPIPADYIKNDIAFCPRCQKGIQAKYLTDLRIFKLSTSDLAKVVHQIFLNLGQNADIYCKYSKDDPHFQLMIRERGWAAANRYKGMFIYPLHRILQDTAHGADIVKCFRIFLSS